MGLKRSRFLLLAAACVTAITAATPAVADTLQEALTKAYQNNPSLQVARANLRATDENVPIRRADSLPSLNGTGTYTENVYSTAATGADRNAGAQLSLGLPVYAGGSVRNGIRAAETRVLAGREDLRASESGIFARVVAAYMDVIQNEAIVGLTRNNVQVLEVNLQATSDRFQIGDLTRTDVAQSEARLALARGDMRTAEANLIRSRENYIALVGDAPGELQPPPPLPGLPASPDDAVDVALESNPDLLGAKQRASAAGIDIRVAEAARLPRIDV
ncbi:MAG: TolC family protein, partial [Croceibacterium sp.]